MKQRAMIALMPVVAGLAACGSEVTDQLIFLGAPPSPLASYAYSDANSFDDQTYMSLRELNDVKVSFTGSSLPKRLGIWSKKIKGKGNVVMVCDTQQAAGGLPLPLPGIGDVVDVLYDLARAKILYKPAERFNAVVEYDSSQNKMVGMRFVSEDTPINMVKADYGKCE